MYLDVNYLGTWVSSSLLHCWNKVLVPLSANNRLQPLRTSRPLLHFILSSSLYLLYPYKGRWTPVELCVEKYDSKASPCCGAQVEGHWLVCPWWLSPRPILVRVSPNHLQHGVPGGANFLMLLDPHKPVMKVFKVESNCTCSRSFKISISDFRSTGHARMNCFEQKLIINDRIEIIVHWTDTETFRRLLPAALCPA